MVSEHRRHFKYWIAIELFIPILFVLISAIAATLYTVTHPFLRLFGGLDLVAVAGVILLAVRMEIEADKQLQSEQLENFSFWTLMAGIVFLTIYATFKPYALRQEEVAANTPGAEFAAWALAAAALTLYFGGASLAYYAKKLLVNSKEHAA
jgi:hypothetical protein